VLHRLTTGVERRVKVKKTVLKPREDKIEDKHGNNIFISLRSVYN
jgi:hypothetical protein